MIGIRKIEAVSARQIKDYGYLPPASKFAFNSFVSGQMKEIPIISENCDYSERWIEDSGGKYSEFSFSGVTRKKIRGIDGFFNSMVGRKNIFKITFIDGSEAIVGSTEFIPNFAYTEITNGISKKELKFTISLKSLHGVLWNEV